MDQDYECRLLRQINIQNENASPIKAVGVVRSLTPTSSPLSSPSKHGDRFIPSRAGANWSVNFHRINEIEKSHNQNRKTKDGTTDSNKADGLAYSALLKNELLGAGIEKVQDPQSEDRRLQPSTPAKRSLFSYSVSTKRALPEEDGNTVSPYSLSPVSSNSQKLLRSPRKPTRKISKIPFKVLDAPELQDDFYLNLVDWSSLNVLSVGLGTCVYLWSACTSQVTRLCDLSVEGDSVTSVGWSERGNLVAVGTHKGYVQIWDAAAGKKLSVLEGHSERRGSVSPAWRDDPLASTLPHHSRWLRGEGPLSLPPSPSSSSTSSFKTPFPASSREMWSYINSGRREYSSSLFSPPYLFSHHSLYPQDPSLVDARHRYLGKRPNGLDGPGSRTASTSRPLITGEYGNDSSRTRLDISPHSSHANGGRRQQEDLTSRVHSGGPFLSDSQAQEGPEPHSSLQDRHLHGIVKTSSNLLSTSPHPLGPDSRAGRGGLLDHLGATPAEAQIYYSLGSVCHPSPEAQAYPLYSSSGTSMYNLHREPGPRQHNLRNSPHSPLCLPNSHDKSQRDRDRDQERDKVVQRDRERGKDKEKQLHHDKDQERDSERERRRDRERDRGRELSPPHHTSSPALHPSPPALLPHFTKGSLIELASGRLKRVEELRTEDFLRSADTSPEFHLSTCTVLLISPSSTQGFSHLQVHLTDRNTQELLKVLVEYPFFVQDRGWSSCCPQRTTQLYGLPCRQLMEGDVCLALTPTPTQTHRTHSRTSSRAHRTHLTSKAAAEPSSSHREDMPPPPPPPPLPHHPTPTTPAPPCILAAEPPAQEQQRPRKRRWSAPDTLPSTGTDESLSDLPHGSKLMKWQ